MSATIKPPRRPTPAPAAPAAPAPRASAPADLTPAEAELLQAYRGTTNIQQRNMLLGMKGIAKAFPRVTRPALRLIAGGGV